MAVKKDDWLHPKGAIRQDDLGNDNYLIIHTEEDGGIQGGLKHGCIEVGSPIKSEGRTIIGVDTLIAALNQVGLTIVKQEPEKLSREDLKSLGWLQPLGMSSSPIFLFQGHGSHGSLFINHETDGGYVQNITIFEPTQNTAVFKGTCKSIYELDNVMLRTGLIKSSLLPI